MPKHHDSKPCQDMRPLWRVLHNHPHVTFSERRAAYETLKAAGVTS